MARGKNAVVIQQTKHMLEILHAKNFKAMQADDGIDGVRKIIRYRPDLIIAELDIPNLNGLSMARILSVLNINVPMLLTSYRKVSSQKLDEHQNVIGCINNPENQSDEALNNFRIEFTGALRHLEKYEKSETSFEYHFRQHEWANLIGISRRKKILVIDDNDSFRTILLRRLDQTDKYALFSARDGLEGLFKALLTRPDLIITDIVMPTLDGMAMSQMLYILNKPFPIVILTAREDAKLQERAKSATGILEYLNKNILKDPAEFLNRLEELLLEADSMKSSNAEYYQKGETEALEDAQET